MSRGNYAKRRGGGKSPPFIMVRLDLVDSAAWRDLDPVARALYLELKRRFNGSNNGRIGLGCREAATAMNVGVNTAARAFRALRDHCFIEPATPAMLTSQGRRATDWLLTELADDTAGTPPTNAFKTWSTKIPPVPLQRQGVPPQRRKGISDGKNGPLRPTTDTQSPVSPKSASHESDTYISSQRHVAAQDVVVAPAPYGRVNEDGQAGGPIPIGEALLKSRLLQRARGVQ